MLPRISVPSTTRPCHILHRTFTTSPTLCRTPPKVNPLKLLPATASPPPPYPYGIARFYKQANTGLYGGQSIQFGNNISSRTETKTRRRWSPNINRKQIYSRALGHRIRVKVSSRVMRTIDKVGGIDEYLLGGKADRVRELGVEGWNLRWAVVQRLAGQKRGKADHRVQMVLAGMKEVSEDGTVVGAVPIVQTTPRTRNVQENMEGRIEQRLAEQRARFMKETAVPMTMWQRMKSMVGMRT